MKSIKLFLALTAILCVSILYAEDGGLGWNCFYPNQVGAQSHVIPCGCIALKISLVIK